MSWLLRVLPRPLQPSKINNFNMYFLLNTVVLHCHRCLPEAAEARIHDDFLLLIPFLYRIIICKKNTSGTMSSYLINLICHKYCISWKANDFLNHLLTWDSGCQLQVTSPFLGHLIFLRAEETKTWCETAFCKTITYHTQIARWLVDLISSTFTWGGNSCSISLSPGCY